MVFTEKQKCRKTLCNGQTQEDSKENEEMVTAEHKYSQKKDKQLEIQNKEEYYCYHSG